MKNELNWKPSKYLYRNGKLFSNTDSNYINAGSYLISSLVARHYSDNIPLFVKGDLVDLGCGKAPLYAIYQHYAKSYTTVDWDNGMHGEDYVDITCDLNQKLPFSPEKFDCVILSDVLEHIVNPSNLLMEINRILVSDGVLLMNVPFFYWLHEMPHDYYRFTISALKFFLLNNGYEEIKIEPVGGVLEVGVDIISKLVRVIPIVGRPIAFLLQGINLLFLKSILGKKILRRTARHFPLGYFIVARKKSSIE